MSVTFGAPAGYPGLEARKLTVADLNGDQRPDIVAVGKTTGGAGPSVTVFINKGNGTFGSAISLPYSAATADDVAVGDFNGDTNPDIAVASSQDSKITCYLAAGANTNSSSPTFAAATTTSFGTTLNADPLTELIVGKFGAGKDSLMVIDAADDGRLKALSFNSNTGNLGSAITLQFLDDQSVVEDVKALNHIAFGDFNGDGLSDIVYQTLSHVDIQYGTGGGNFNTVVTRYQTPDPLIEPMVVGPLTSSGSSDIVFPSSVSNALTGHINIIPGGKGALVSTPNYPNGSRGFIGLGDFDGDGKTDVMMDDNFLKFAFFANPSGNGSLGAEQDISIPSDSSPFEVADLNGDGKADLVLPVDSGNNSAITVYINGGSSTGGGGGGGGGATALTGTLAGKLPATVIAGQKTAITESINLTNTGATLLSGAVSAKLYLSTGTTVDSNSIQIASQSHKAKLKARAKTAFRFSVTKIGSTVPSGTYHAVLQVTDPTGATTDIASASTFNLAQPIVDLSGSFVKTPVAPKSRRTPLTFNVKNTGNVIAGGKLSFNVQSSADASGSSPVQIIKLSSKVTIKPGKTVKVISTATLPAGTYFVTITLDPDNTFHEPSLGDNTFTSATAVTVS